jgi:UDP:flavonoid glycosyltransferase YjiC (YdhE family)
MHSRHICFFLDQAYGNTIPSFGITMELKRRGHKVSYVVTESFAPLIRSVGAIPIVIDFVEIRAPILAGIMNVNDHTSYRLPLDEAKELKDKYSNLRTQHALSQMDRLRSEGPLHLVIHDDSIDTTGRSVALEMGAPKILLRTQFIEEKRIGSYAGNELVLVTVPRFFQRSIELFEAEARFKFVGFMPEGRSLPFRPWQPLSGDKPRVLVSPTSGLMQQIDFCKQIVAIFAGQPWDVILSISASQDRLSAIDPDALANVPENIHINHDSGNFDILPNVDLFIGQAGQGGTLEAIYWGVPQILFPPTPYHGSVARRVCELGLGISLSVAEMSHSSLLAHAARLVGDAEMRTRLQECQQSMRRHSSATMAADTVESHLREARTS